MKKLMTALSSAAIAIFAFGAVNGQELTSTGFETGAYTAGEPIDTEKDDAGVAVESDTRVWAQATDVESTVKAYGEDKPAIAGVTAEDLGDQYLEVEGKITRLAQEGGESVDIGDGLYIDTIVKFTATDADTESPEGIEEGDKLCVWLKGNEEDDTQCTLMVTAGYIVDFEASSIASHSYETTTKLANNSWHHLQVKVLPAMDDDGYLGNGFVVYIDGQAVAATESVFNSDEEPEYTFNARAAAYASENKLFPSLIPYGGNGDGTITSLAFNGSGAVDNISFTQGTDPNPILIPAALEPVVASEAKRTYTGEEITGVDFPEGAFGYELADNMATEVGSYTATATLFPGFAWTGENNTPIYTAKVIAWSIVEGGSGSDGYDSGDGVNKFTIDSAKEAALTAKLAGKTLGDVADATTGMTYAQAYALGLFDEETGDIEELDATISIGADGKVTVTLANAPTDGYLVTCKVYEKASLTAEWPTEATTEYAYGNEQAFTPGSATAGFYKVAVVITNAPQQ